jgi:hypothetical protein
VHCELLPFISKGIQKGNGIFVVAPLITKGRDICKLSFQNSFASRINIGCNLHKHSFRWFTNMEN